MPEFLFFDKRLFFGAPICQHRSVLYQGKYEPQAETKLLHIRRITAAASEMPSLHLLPCFMQQEFATPLTNLLGTQRYVFTTSNRKLLFLHPEHWGTIPL